MTTVIYEILCLVAFSHFVPLCQQEGYNAFERAIIAAYSGNLEKVSVLMIFISSTWSEACVQSVQK